MTPGIPIGEDDTVRLLTAAAKNRVAGAVSAWLTSDFDRAASAAPEACELLGKAALWSVNPALLVQLEANAERSLVSLATSPSLNSPNTRTIGLAAVLQRAGLVWGTLPISEKRRRRLTDCRNGFIHVGTLPTSGQDSSETIARRVLSDSFLICHFLLEHLNTQAKDFYGDMYLTVNTLLNERRSEVEHRVSRLIDQAHHQVSALRAQIGDDTIWIQSAQGLEAAAAMSVAPEMFGPEMGAVDQRCPNCNYTGRLIGRVHLRDEVDFDVSDGESWPTMYWEIWFDPNAFGCNVCKLRFHELAELVAAGLPTGRRKVEEQDLGDDFAVADWVEATYGRDEHWRGD